MAKIFKDKLIRKKLEKYEISNLIEKIAIIKKWLQVYKNGSLKNLSESECEQSFNSDFFVDILGYKTFPNNPTTLTPKKKIEGTGQKPDAVLGYFGKGKEKISAVVEIKDVNIPLDKSQKREGNLSPVQQAFKYKTQFSECPFVIATNFYEIRILRDNQLDFESFTLESLVDSKNDYFNFKKFYFLLSADNFVVKTGKSKTEELLSEIRLVQDKISKDFYKEYRELRGKLIKDIAKNNKEAQKKSKFMFLAVEKAQKIIDRMVFICFCEDRDLLPENTLQKVIKYGESGFSSMWDTFKGLFNAIDKGSEKLEIKDGYNGELFKPDKDLDDLKISDEVIKDLAKLGTYDFSEAEEGGEIDVNILGHIFEQSISDIEYLKTKTQIEEVDQKQSKRKKDGIFYTPDYIVDYIVKNSLGKYLEEKEEEAKEKHKLKEGLKDKDYNKRELQAYLEYQKTLQDVKVLDPACGSGAFLVKVFDYLLAENQRISSITSQLQGGKKDLFGGEAYIKHLLQKNIYGVDINKESVEITKLSLWLKTVKKGEKLTVLKDNIKCGNSLIDDPNVAGEKAFKWEEEFKGVFERGGFDVVVGNPPYVFARGGNFTDKEKSYYYKNFKLQEYQINTYILFSEKSENLLKENGYLGFIIPNNWQTIDTCFNFRKHVFEKLGDIKIVNSQEKIFESANVDNGILIFKKVKKGNFKFVEFSKGKFIQVSKGEKFVNDKFIINFNLLKNSKNQSILRKIESSSNKLEDLTQVSTGIKVYQVGKGKPVQTEKIKNQREYHSFVKRDDNYKKYLEGKDVKRYFLDWSHEYLNYGDWIAEPRKSIDFSKERILVRQIPSPYPRCINAVYTNGVFINDINSMVVFDFKEYSPTFILLILNSRLISFWFINTFDKLQRGLFPQFKVRELKIFPIPKIPKESQQPFIAKADLMLKLNKELHQKLKEVLEFLKHKFNLKKTPKKLEKFWELKFKEFIRALKIKKFSLEEESELMKYFNKNKEELRQIKDRIDQEDKIIDEMVFDLYGLTEEEREIVLKG